MTVLVLAASRKGPEDAVAIAGGVSHKCLIELAGVVMIERVVSAVLEATATGRVLISIDDPNVLDRVPAIRDLIAAGRVTPVASGDTLYESLLTAIDAIEDPFPLMVTTGDNALHTAEMIDHFCVQALASGADAVAGFTPAELVMSTYTDGARAFHAMKDGGWSSCNIYALLTAKAAVAARSFAGGGQFGKRPWRILKAFGIGTLIRYKLKRLTIDEMMTRIAARFGITGALVRMPYADAPIDVDNARDVTLATKILLAR